MARNHAYDDFDRHYDDRRDRLEEFHRYDRELDRPDRYDNRAERSFGARFGDEVRSWFGDEEAERRRTMDDIHGYDPRFRPPQSDDHARYGWWAGAPEGREQRGYDRPESRGDDDRGRFDPEYGSRRAPWSDHGYREEYGSGYAGSPRRGPESAPRPYGDSAPGYSGQEERMMYGGRNERDSFGRAGDRSRPWFDDEETERRRHPDARGGGSPGGYDEHRGRGRSGGDPRNIPW